jgi:hypothetical protein
MTCHHGRSDAAFGGSPAAPAPGPPSVAYPASPTAHSPAPIEAYSGLSYTTYGLG